MQKFGDNEKRLRCAIYTRKSTTYRLESDTNSLVTQRQVCSAYITSQQYKGWVELPNHYDDGGQTGGNLERPALTRLMRDIEQGKIDSVVVYKIDRLTRSLVDFVRLIDLFEERRISLVSISQAFDTSDSMGRMVLNILLTFSQFEREMIGERVRESINARKRHGKIHGGKAPLGYDFVDNELVIDEHEAPIIRFIFDQFLATERYGAVMRAVEEQGFKSSIKKLKKGGTRGDKRITSATIYKTITNPVYIGEIKGSPSSFKGRHEPLISRETWEAAQRLAKSRRRPQPNSRGTRHFLAARLIDELGRHMLLELSRYDPLHSAYYASSRTKWCRAKHIRQYRTHAGRFDALVTSAIVEFLRDRIRLRQALRTLGIANDELEKFAALGDSAATRLKETKPQFLEEVYKALTTQIEIGRDHVTISIRPFELHRFLGWKDQTAFRARPRDWPLSNASFDIKLDVRVLSRVTLPLLHIRPQAVEGNEKPDPSLTSLVQSARAAQQLLENNRHLQVKALAGKAQVRATQFVRLIRLNYLAPDIVASIFDGTQPKSLTRKVLLTADIPTSWPLQREMLGFPPPVQHIPERKDRLVWNQKGNS